MAKALSPKERAFCEHYVKTADKVESYKAAGYAIMDRDKIYNKLNLILARPKVKEYIALLKEKRMNRVGISQDMVLKRLWAIASADPNELVAVKVSNCRHCWGKDFKYQYTDDEFENLLEEAERLGLEEPNTAGGDGFNLSRPPHPDCPACGGVGKAKVAISDTQTLSPQARVLYAGAEQTRNGIKVKMHDQLAALVKVADHLGMFESATIEELRQANLKKLNAEADAMGRDVAPVQVNIQVVDASKPSRVRGDEDDSSQSDTEHTSV